MSHFTNPAGRAPEAAEGYVSALLGMLGDRDPVTVMTGLDAALDDLLTGVDDELLRRPEAPGKWSMIDVVAHLTDTELVYAWRYRMPLTEDAPPLQGFDQDAWARRFDYRAWPLDPTRTRLRVVREANLELLRSLAPADWDRPAMHAERGRETVRRIAQLGAGHDLVHRAQLERIRKAIQA